MNALRRTALASTVFFGLSVIHAAEPDPKVLSYKLLKDVKWADTESGIKQAVLFGDPAKPGWYAVLGKWEKNKMSRPHFHANDRHITVLSGTWWIGTGAKYDPASTKPVPAGTYVTHFAKQVHYDGAKDEDVILEIVGMGPATSTGAEQK
ncbi:MAG: cupin domain-containing protein [Acidobacteriota bacterium]